MKKKTADGRMGLFKVRNKDGKVEYRISLFHQAGKLLGKFKTNGEARHAMHEDIKSNKGS